MTKRQSALKRSSTIQSEGKKWKASRSLLIHLLLLRLDMMSVKESSISDV